MAGSRVAAAMPGEAGRDGPERRDDEAHDGFAPSPDDEDRPDAGVGGEPAPGDPARDEAGPAGAAQDEPGGAAHATAPDGPDGAADEEEGDPTQDRPGRAEAQAFRLRQVRTRVRVFGVGFILFAALFAVQVGPVVLQVVQGDDLQPLFSHVPGGDVTVQVVGPAAQGALVELRELDGGVFSNATAANGTARFDDVEHAAHRVAVVAGADEWIVRAWAPGASDIEVTVDTAGEPGTAAQWQGTATSTMAWTYTLIFALLAVVVAGGAAAFRRRGRRLALAGSVGFILFSVSAGLSGGGFLMLGIGVAFGGWAAWTFAKNPEAFGAQAEAALLAASEEE